MSTEVASRRAQYIRTLFRNISVDPRSLSQHIRAREIFHEKADEGCRLWLCVNYLQGVWLSESVDDALLGDTEDVVSLVVEGGADRPERVPERTWIKLLNLWATMRMLKLDSFVQSPVRIDVDFVLAVHASVMGGGLMASPGEFRTQDVKAAHTSVTYAPHSSVKGKTRALMDFVRENLDGEVDISRAFSLAIGFFSEFLKIHPFSNGNGRVARILVNVILAPFVIVPFTLRAATPDSNARYLRALQESQWFDNHQPLVDLFVQSSALASDKAVWLLE